MRQIELAYLETEVRMACDALRRAGALIPTPSRQDQVEIEIERAACLVDRARTRIASYRLGMCGECGRERGLTSEELVLGSDPIEGERGEGEDDGDRG